ncbi:carbon-nitrogen hydrolase family protein [Actinacidiphila sp. ITFR-21]|uniref:carbon-nitrogen hydrolase family protein n=1 Tax=Actinacidiphila sp. ITFR-21 TaxID=3075199 RepID=UPI00288B4BDB|nr:carbon-nitrogen hydrolase family protein [Streptomyces sp. ITFR-21]WNI17243.1 carbon-nitrogen hydrolase family protein [Streptomyces sp. ITFR-21]
MTTDRTPRGGPDSDDTGPAGPVSPGTSPGPPYSSGADPGRADLPAAIGAGAGAGTGPGRADPPGTGSGPAGLPGPAPAPAPAPAGSAGAAASVGAGVPSVWAVLRGTDAASEAGAGTDSAAVERGPAPRVVRAVPPRTLRVAVAQIGSGTDPAANLGLIGSGAERAAAAGADLVVFPEAAMCRFGVPLASVAQPLDGPWARGVRAIAAASGVTVVAGMFTPADGGRVHNTVVVAGPGRPLRHYDKIHLYDAFGYRESQTVAPGHEPLTVDVAGVTVGVATCYDIRFPGLFTELAGRGAQVIVVPASWGAGPGKLDQWTLLARARAMDTTAYLVGCDQADPGEAVPPGPAPTGVGGSLAVSPLGDVLDRLGPEPGFAVWELDLREVGAVRASIPVLANRRW